MLTTTLVLLLSTSPSTFQAQDTSWVDLFNGKNYAGFKFWIIAGPERTFDVQDGCMVFHPVPKGTPYTTDRVLPISDTEILSRVPLIGYTYTTKEDYKNFELKYEWRYERPINLASDGSFNGNSGVFLYKTRVLKSWPASIEVDGRYTEVGRLLAHGKAQGEFKDYPDARKKAMKPVGQWNDTHVLCKDGSIKVTVNGQLVAEGTTDQREGSIGFQAQGATIYYRNIKVHELK